MAEAYCTLQDIRDEGVTIAEASDARVTAQIALASRYIERLTGRWFDAQTRTFKVRARNTAVLFLDHPIVSVSAINIVSGRGANLNRDELSVDDVLVFNRHLTEGLTNPDDRDNPKLEYSNFQGYEYPGSEEANWPWGSQVVEVAGKFGYTELTPSDTPGETSDGSQVPNSDGVTPPLIVHACKLLAMRELALMSDPAERGEWRDRFRLESEKTADQSYKMTSLDSLNMQGAWTGDPEIDAIIALYVAPPESGAV